MAGVPRLADESVDPDAPAMSMAQNSGTGFLAGLFGGNRAATAPPEEEGAAPSGATVTEASLPAADASKSEIAFGTSLPYGRVATICGVDTASLGQRSAQYPERRPRYQLYDSAPGSTEPHTFYITGFDDGCARQFTAAMAVFGSVEMHEQLRYGLPAEVQPYSDTDKAYEKLKRRVCNKPRRKPCGSRIGQMAKDTVFVSVYERFGGNAQWMNLLLHGGDLVAQDRKTGL
ncbi:MAG: hypothetical protein RIB69_02260 [Roseovarius sp.]